MATAARLNRTFALAVLAGAHCLRRPKAGPFRPGNLLPPTCGAVSQFCPARAATPTSRPRTGPRTGSTGWARRVGRVGNEPWYAGACRPALARAGPALPPSCYVHQPARSVHPRLRDNGADGHLRSGGSTPTGNLLAPNVANSSGRVSGGNRRASSLLAVPPATSFRIGSPARARGTWQVDDVFVVRGSSRVGSPLAHGGTGRPVPSFSQVARH